MNQLSLNVMPMLILKQFSVIMPAERGSRWTNSPDMCSVP